MTIAKIKLFIAEKRKLILLVLLTCVILCIPFWIDGLLAFWTSISISDTSKGIIGTLCGAIIGGLFTLLGTFAVSKHEAKAQTWVRRKNIILKPLYDELNATHQLIANNEFYPREALFDEPRYIIRDSVKYLTWGRIKKDSRFLEVPSSIRLKMDELYQTIQNYNLSKKALYQSVEKCFAEITKANGAKILSKISANSITEMLLDEGADENELRFSISIECSDRTVADTVYNTLLVQLKEAFSLLPEYNELKNKKMKWNETEAETIALLATMIKYITVKYEE